jgi:hypothetical protein
LVTGAENLVALGGVRYAQGGMFMRAHEMLCRLVSFSPHGEGPNPARSGLDADFGELAFHAIG